MELVVCHRWQYIIYGSWMEGEGTRDFLLNDRRHYLAIK